MQSEIESTALEIDRSNKQFSLKSLPLLFAAASIWLGFNFALYLPPLWFWINPDLAAVRYDGAWIIDGADCATPSMYVGLDPPPNLPSSTFVFPRLRREFFHAFIDPDGHRPGRKFFTRVHSDWFIFPAVANFEVSDHGKVLVFVGMSSANTRRGSGYYIKRMNSEWERSLPRYAKFFSPNLRFSRCK